LVNVCLVIRMFIGVFYYDYYDYYYYLFFGVFFWGGAGYYREVLSW